MNHFKRLTIKAAALLISAGLVLGNYSVAAMAAPAAPITVPAPESQPAGTQTTAQAATQTQEKWTSVHIPEEAQIYGTGNKLSGIRITDLEAPVPGKPFDTEATLTSADGRTWVVPVLWMDANKEPAGPIAEGKVYYPVIIYYMPFGTVMDPADGNLAWLDEKTTALFGHRGILSVYDAEHQFTLILPGDLYLPAQPAGSGSTDSGNAAPAYNPSPAPASSTSSGTPQGGQEQGGEGQGSEGGQEQGGEGQGSEGGQEQGDEEQTDPRDELVTLYCSKTAKDAFANNMEQLKELVDMVVNRLEPQAVNLLKNKFPSFTQAAEEEMPEIGKKIGLYVYYEKGDADGLKEHQDTPEQALAYVSGSMATFTDDSIRYCYMIGVDAACFSVEDSQGNPYLNKNDSPYFKSDKNTMDDLDNTIVHEMFHAFMDDYNRTGMAGCTNAEDLFYNRNLTNEEVDQLFDQTRFPSWFIEGSASMVENVYQYRNTSFNDFRRDFKTAAANGEDTQTVLDTFTKDNMADVYVLSGFKDGYKSGYYDIEMSDAKDSTKLAGSRYVSGYLACLYLGELAAYYKNGNSARTIDPNTNQVIYSSEVLRNGFDAILKDLHDGKTLDEEIREISNGAFQDTDDFSKRFIKGEFRAEDKTYLTDENSLVFCVDFLNYMNSLSVDGNTANGSVLYDFDELYKTPIDRNVEASTDFYVINGKNETVDSSVPNDIALAGGGKSRSGTNTETTQQAEPQTTPEITEPAEIPAAAKSEEEPAAEEPAVVEEPVVAEELAEEEVAAEEEPAAEVEPVETEPVVAAEPQILEFPVQQADLTDQAAKMPEEAVNEQDN